MQENIKEAVQEEVTEVIEQDITQEVEEVSLRDALKNTFNDLSKEEDEEEEVDVGEDATEGDEEEIVEEQGEQDGVDMSTPANWSPTEKEAFEKIKASNPEEAKIFKTRFDNMSRGFDEKSQRLAKITNAFSEIKPIMDQQGLTEEGLITSYLDWDKRMREQPIETIRELMDMNNVNLTDFGDSDEFEDEEIRQLRKDSRELKALTERTKRQQTTAKENELLNEAAAFANETNEKGELKHPHLSNSQVQSKVAALRLQGVSLEDAYEEAIWSIPSVRKELVSNISPKQPSREEQRAKVAKAKNASLSLGNTSPNKSAVKSKELSLREELRKTYRGLNS